MREKTKSILVWDLPTRLFHWLLAAGIAVLWASGELGKLDLHFLASKAVLTLLLFRLAWGFVGSDTARFGQFVRGPKAIAAYLAAARAGTVRSVGHNPLGALSVLALLGLLLIQGISGLFTSDDISSEGPLTWLASGKVVAVLSTIHRAGFKLLLALVGLHLAAVIFYARVKKDDLVVAMVSGKKRVPEGVTGIRPANPLLALAILAACGAIVFGGLALYGK